VIGYMMKVIRLITC